MSYNTPEPNGQRCVYCGQPVHNHEDCIASKPKGSKVWLFAHTRCAYPKKEADKGVRLK